MSNTGVKTYSADQVVVTFCGQQLRSGFTDGEFLKITPAGPDFTKKVGADGETARSKTNDRTATAKIKLMETSEGNNILQQIRELDLASANGAGVGVFEVTDLTSGVRLAHAPKAWIAAPPSPGRGKEVGEYEWTIDMGPTEFDFSGSPSV